MDDKRDGNEFECTDSKLEFRHCVGDDDYPFEIVTITAEGVTVGLDLTLVDSIRLYKKLGDALTAILMY